MVLGRRGMMFLMLNPSKADAKQDDNTISKCVQFAHRHGCDTLTVVNLFAFRATYPIDLIRASLAGIDIIGPMNREMLRENFIAPRNKCDWHFVAAFGSLDKTLESLLLRENLRRCVFGALAMASHMQALKVNKSGWPTHPAARDFSYSWPLEPYRLPQRILKMLD